MDESYEILITEALPTKLFTTHININVYWIEPHYLMLQMGLTLKAKTWTIAIKKDKTSTKRRT